WDIHVLRDPTRGGVGTTLNEIAARSDVGMTLFEKDLPVKKEVNAVCELLGFDPLYIANEGKLIAIVPEKYAGEVLDIIRADVFGRDAAIIGDVTDQDPGKVFMETAIGGRRLVDMLTGEQLPRIC
ncbi:MAG: AIR synthase-related protein, partial [Desulfotignum sp.]|nr:AIR synthase-related protein [Desulfotignum sp.]